MMVDLREIQEDDSSRDDSSKRRRISMEPGQSSQEQQNPEHSYKVMTLVENMPDKNFFCFYCGESQVLRAGYLPNCSHFGHWLLPDKCKVPESKVERFSYLPQPKRQTDLVINIDASKNGSNVGFGILFRTRKLDFVWAFSCYGKRPIISSATEAEAFCLLIAIKLAKEYKALLVEKGVEVNHVLVYTDSKNSVEVFNGDRYHRYAVLQYINRCRNEIGLRKRGE